MTRLADLTTLRIGGAAQELITVTTEADLIAAVQRCDEAGTDLLVLGGGSNLVVGDEGFAGTVVLAHVQGISVITERDEVIVTAGCGEPWDALVAYCVSQGWAGIEAMSGIPGCVGATPIQNVGAYGQDVASVITNVRVYDRDACIVRDLAPGECAFAYRDSVFKHQPDRWIVLAVSFRLVADPWSVVMYAQLAEALGIAVGETATSAAIRDAVLALRRSKGMVVDPDDPDTRSAGSFFTNPILDAGTAATLPETCPRYPSTDGVKVSAAWLIEHSGIGKGWQVRPNSTARVSTKHTLALTTVGDASSRDLLELARAIQLRVRERFGIELEAEPRLVNCSL